MYVQVAPSTSRLVPDENWPESIRPFLTSYILWNSCFLTMMLLRLVCILLLATAAPVVSIDLSVLQSKVRTRALLPEKDETNALIPFRRSLQTAKYRVNYQARFQWLLENSCGGPNPIINVLCLGKIELLGTSHPTIVCEPLGEPTADGFNGYQCKMTCADRAACKNVWLSTNINNGPFGEIFFQCEGEEVIDVDGAMQFLGSEGNTCSSNILGDGRNVHVAQLGVFCAEKYNYANSAFFECDINDANRAYGGYTCLAGDNCGGVECTRDIDTVNVHVDHFRLGECIQSLDGSELPEPVEPALVQRPAGTYSAKFRADWSLKLSSCCTGKFPTILVECTNGEISDVKTIFGTTSCVVISSTSINCTESDSDTFLGSYSGVEFVSFLDGGEFPGFACTNYLPIYRRHAPPRMHFQRLRPRTLITRRAATVTVVQATTTRNFVWPFSAAIFSREAFFGTMIMLSSAQGIFILLKRGASSASQEPWSHPVVVST